MSSERLAEIRKNHANCDTRNGPCDAEDLLAFTDALIQERNKLKVAIRHLLGELGMFAEGTDDPRFDDCDECRAARELAK